MDLDFEIKRKRTIGQENFSNLAIYIILLFHISFCIFNNKEFI